MPHRLSFFIFIFLPFLGNTQKLLKGTITDEKNAPIPKASVFLNNTSIGTTADENGNFSLSIPQGKFELIVSSIGFITHNQSITTMEVADFLTIQLKVRAPELQTIVIEPYEKDGWQKWGRWFIEHFLGTSEYGKESKIKNPDVLRFRNSRQNGELTVTALEPLVIENKGLGYRITYQLETFRYDFTRRYILYAGYPFFENLEGSDRKKRAWEKARDDVYHGSMLQFMRSVYRNKIREEGFEVRRLKKPVNAEKQRVKSVYKTSIKANERGQMISTINRDSSDYYNQVLTQNDYHSIIGRDILVGDSIAYAADSTTASLFFEDYLLVTYTKKTVPYEYKTFYPKSDDAIRSEITLINNRPVEIQANGSYYNPEDLLSSGYWGWWEKLGTMLPFDFKPMPTN
jgi:hypothetical protein